MLHGTDFDQIRAVVGLYLDGMIRGQADKLRQAFHPKATATGHYQGTYPNDPPEVFIADWLALEPLPPETPYAADLTLIDLTGDVAVAKVTNTCFGDDYTDYLTLIRHDGAWQITHKAWFCHPQTVGTNP